MDRRSRLARVWYGLPSQTRGLPTLSSGRERPELPTPGAQGQVWAASPLVHPHRPRTAGELEHAAQPGSRGRTGAGDLAREGLGPQRPRPAPGDAVLTAPRRTCFGYYQRC